MIQYELALDDDVPELTDYSVRVSNRAKNACLRVLPVTGLEITIPRWFRRRDIPELISTNREWIEAQLAYVRERTNPEFLVWPPRVLNLRSHAGSEGTQGLELAVVCSHVAGSHGLSGQIKDGTLEISGDTSDRQLLLQLLAKLLKQEARLVFQPQLESYASRFELTYKKLVIRGQRTLWGSYSSTGTLSLNFKLLFLPPELTRYVLLHELAHTRFLDHSPAFWRCLKAMEPNARTFDRALNQAGDYVPPWLESVT